jgi:hypothetical protein
MLVLLRAFLKTDPYDSYTSIAGEGVLEGTLPGRAWSYVALQLTKEDETPERKSSKPILCLRHLVNAVGCRWRDTLSRVRHCSLPFWSSSMFVALFTSCLSQRCVC